MSDAVSRLDPATALDRLITTGDVGQLSEKERIAYYVKVCESLGVNPYTQPFAFIRFQGRMVMYATRNLADQLRNIHKVSTEVVSTDEVEGIYTVRVRARTVDGRCHEDVGAVPIAGLTADAKANAIMRAHTKACRRATLSLCGLGWLDQSELDTMPEAEHVQFKLPPEKPTEKALPEEAGGEELVPTALAGDPPAPIDFDDVGRSELLRYIKAIAELWGDGTAEQNLARFSKWLEREYGRRKTIAFSDDELRELARRLKDMFALD